MLAAERHRQILRSVSAKGALSVTRLAHELGVSDVTIRRDLKALTDRGLVTKVHGGVTAEPSDFLAHEPAFADVMTRHSAEKAAIAREAAKLVAPGDSVALLGGTTVYAVARELLNHQRLTIITNSLPISTLFATRGTAAHTVVLTGGLRTPTDSLVGPLAQDSFSTFHVDIAFLGSYGLDPQVGLSSPNILEADMNRTVMEKAARICVVTDHSKWGVRAFSSFCSLNQVTTLITDSGMEPQHLRVLRHHISDIRLATPEKETA
jgi:DeoR/GlpR family transcriptional regulator of sugar metabolism